MQATHSCLSHPCPGICPEGCGVRDVTDPIQGVSLTVTPQAAGLLARGNTMVVQPGAPSSAASGCCHHGGNSVTPGTHSMAGCFKECVLCVLGILRRCKGAGVGVGVGGRAGKAHRGRRVAAKGQTPATVLGGRLGVVLIFFFIILLFSNFSLMNRYYFHTQKNMCFVLRAEGVEDPLLSSCGLWTLKPRPRVGKTGFTRVPILKSSTRNPLFLGQRAGVTSGCHSPGKERATSKSLQHSRIGSQGSVGESFTKRGMEMGLWCMIRSLAVRK